MGLEIPKTSFTEEDYQCYADRLAQETKLLHEWFDQSQLSSVRAVGGFELEAWLVNNQHSPAPINKAFLKRLSHPLVVPELSKFNIEINVNPQGLADRGLKLMEQELNAVWSQCQHQAEELNSSIISIGILPTVHGSDLTIENMSTSKRYQALNEQVLKQRHGRPLNLDIVGQQHLQSKHADVMLEAAATSFQIHLQTSMKEAQHFYNAAILCSAPMVAISANSPFLFGKKLWEESRIPLFEQAVEVGGYDGAAHGPIKRVSFGSGYARQSIMECFDENSEHYPVLLPIVTDSEPKKLDHLRLHNGTIWRWNRPLIGFDEDGTPHIRIEHRVVAAGPTLADQLANAAFFYGLTEALVYHRLDEEFTYPTFADCKSNFYEAARHGIKTKINWLNNNRKNIQRLVLEDLLPLADEGLSRLGVNADDIGSYLTIIEARVRSGQTGSAWQQAYVKRYGDDMAALTSTYIDNQSSGHPVHNWEL